MFEGERLGHFFTHGLALVAGTFAQFVFYAVFSDHHAGFAGIPLEFEGFFDVGDAVALVEGPGQFIGHVVGEIEGFYRIRMFCWYHLVFLALVVPDADFCQLLQGSSSDFVYFGVGQEPMLRKIHGDFIGDKGGVAGFGKVLLDVFEQSLGIFSGFFGGFHRYGAGMSVFVRHVQGEAGFGFDEAHGDANFSDGAVFVFHHPVELGVVVAVYFGAYGQGLQFIGHHDVVDDDVDLRPVAQTFGVDEIEAVAVVEQFAVFNPVAVAFYLQQFADILPLGFGAFPRADFPVSVVEEVVGVTPVEAAVEFRFKIVECPA